MFSQYSPTHIANIVCHIVGGTLAILAGLIAIIANKRSRLHGRAGLVFVSTYGLVILTAVLGAVVFEFRSFLLVATIASSYSLFSGFRATRLRGRRPTALDRAVALLGLAAPVLFIAGMEWLHQPWNPVLTWTVLGSLIATSSFDLVRTRLSSEWLRKVWVQEHLIKMIGAFDALTATFAATIFPHFQPWSAIIPNLVGLILTGSFIFAGPRAWSMQPRSSVTDPGMVQGQEHSA